MSEFLDFLKHKYAYVAFGTFKSGRFAEAQRLYEKAVSTYTQGFQGAYLLQKPGTDQGIAVIFWDTIQDMEENQSQAYKKILKEMSHLFATPPETAFYEVCSEIKPEKAKKLAA
ncbi:MAG: antibiotic biosynthesis monooxygenase [Cyanobacteria bacterium J083]|nr:MAG: antibiotic biosynthesis monooxygenase [Cyanobacteria bacterium J083]